MARRPCAKCWRRRFKEFREALVPQGVHERDHKHLDRPYNGAKDFVDFDFLLDGPGALRKNRPRKSS